MIWTRLSLVLFLALSVFCMTWSGPASAATTTTTTTTTTVIPTPTTLPGGTVITASAAKTLLDAKTAVFFDVRSSSAYSAGHIPGTANVHYTQRSLKTTTFDATLDQFDLTALPATKSATIVFYSNGINGWRSYKAAILAIRQGYTNVRWLRGGMVDWVAAKYSVESAPAGI
ncbi:rhodanese-like domain-containing protein [Pelotalea chapellei]|uniref:Rhodanese-like domain-containing protein n=1 Tax=Pelotalea chapellei TaxID=44671 RepID=A0ABS5UBQ8_9BACT|nr:rhodanese-like domain-containing protein [Pelotalea chapellei]MBT1073129.1 rhodanese-like domain-containing protein [Pelotalea chapellei]